MLRILNQCALIRGYALVTHEMVDIRISMNLG